MSDVLAASGLTELEVEEAGVRHVQMFARYLKGHIR